MKYEALGNLVHIKHGYAFKSEFFSFTNGSQIVLTPGNFDEKGGFKLRNDKDRFYTGEYPSDFLLKKNDMIIAMTEQTYGLLGSPAIIPENNKYLHNQRLGKFVILNKGRVSKKYLYYLFFIQGLRDEISISATGTKIRHTSPDRVYKIRIPLPFLPIQRKIAAVLSAYDDLIENNNRRITILEKMAEEMYREWFVRLRFPGNENVKIVKGVPEGWEITEAGKYFELIKGRSYSSNEISDFKTSDTFLNFITLKNFKRGGGFRSDDKKYFCGKFTNNQVVTGGSLVIAVTDMTQDRAVIGRVARIPQFYKEKSVISCDVVKIVPKKVQDLFIYATLRYSQYPEMMKEFANGANVLHLKPDLIIKQMIVVPSKAIQDKFVASFEPLIYEIDSLASVNGKLSSIRDRLLSRLMSGKLDLEDLNIKFPPSMKEELTN